MKTPHERALDRLTLLAPRMHHKGIIVDALVRCLEVCEEARDAVDVLEMRPDAHQLVSLPALRAAIRRVDEAVVG